MLYPYRPSSVKNRQRWTFGGLFPRGYSEAQAGAEPWRMQTECLLEAADGDAVLEVRMRFLHLLDRTVGEITTPAPELAAAEPDFQPVAALWIGERLFQSWQEATEREIVVGDVRLRDLVGKPQQVEFRFAASRGLELLRDAGGVAVGVLVREQQAVEGAIELAAEPLGEGAFKISARVLNTTPILESALARREQAQLSSFASTHIILGVRDGAFVSAIDPPEQLQAAAATCANVGCWPVLVGEEGDRSIMLASPIILYDYPQVAPESPGDLFDGTEIDEILTLRIMTLTDEEKREMSASDERARALLARTDALARDELMRLHGTVRSLRPKQP
jgi:hydrogenase maturation protease